MLIFLYSEIICWDWLDILYNSSLTYIIIIFFFIILVKFRKNLTVKHPWRIAQTVKIFYVIDLEELFFLLILSHLSMIAKRMNIFFPIVYKYLRYIYGRINNLTSIVRERLQNKNMIFLLLLLIEVCGRVLKELDLCS